MNKSISLIYVKLFFFFFDCFHNKNEQFSKWLCSLFLCNIFFRIVCSKWRHLHSQWISMVFLLSIVLYVQYQCMCISSSSFYFWVFFFTFDTGMILDFLILKFILTSMISVTAISNATNVLSAYLIVLTQFNWINKNCWLIWITRNHILHIRSCLPHCKTKRCAPSNTNTNNHSNSNCPLIGKHKKKLQTFSMLTMCELKINYRHLKGIKIMTESNICIICFFLECIEDNP